VTIARPPGGFCHWKPLAGHELGHPCPVCGHSDLVHIGTGHCPVCELVFQATPDFRRREERRNRYPQPLGQRRD
jgi:uncharacterized Zn finger protein (UPF0148 family)